MEYKLLSFKKAKDKIHKYKVELLDMTNNKKFSVKFGAFAMNDYTIYAEKEDEDKDKYKRQYLNRHRKREDWNDIRTPGFWSRWVLWNKPTLKASIFDVVNRYKIKI